MNGGEKEERKSMIVRCEMNERVWNVYSMSVALKIPAKQKFHKPIKCMNHKCGMVKHITSGQFSPEFQMKCGFFMWHSKKKRFYFIFMLDADCVHTQKTRCGFREKKKWWAKTQWEIFFPFINVIPRMIKWKAECAFDLNANVCLCVFRFFCFAWQRVHSSESIQLFSAYRLHFQTAILTEILTIRALIKGINNHQHGIDSLIKQLSIQ